MPWCFDSWRFWNSGNRRESGGCPLGEDQQDSHAGDMSRPAVRCHRVRQKCPQQEVSTWPMFLKTIFSTLFPFQGCQLYRDWPGHSSSRGCGYAWTHSRGPRRDDASREKGDIVQHRKLCHEETIRKSGDSSFLCKMRDELSLEKLQQLYFDVARKGLYGV